MSISVMLVIAIIVGLVLYIWAVYNGLATGKVRIKEAFSGIDVQLKRRIDLIPNLIETVKGYTRHEKTVLEEITKARSSLMQAQTPRQKAESDNALSGALKSLFAVSENYPDLKASQNFLELQEELSDTENKIAYSRQFYNSLVRDYNTMMVTFPSNLIGNMFGYRQEQFFEAKGEEKEPVKVQF